MPRLLINGEWFEAVASDSVYESEYEQLLITNASHLYPDFHLVKFKVDVQSEHGAGRPDLALVDKNYRRWWVVEVELGHHPLKSHVEKQVRIFARARYGQEHARALAERGGLDRDKLVEMMRGTQPRVLVLVNVPRSEWSGWLAPYEALVGVVEVFRSYRNQYVLRINGDQPEALTDDLTVCVLDTTLRRCLRVESPAALPAGDEFSILYQDEVSSWHVLKASDTVWLHPRGRYPLPPNAQYFALLQRGDGQLVLTLHAPS